MRYSADNLPADPASPITPAGDALGRYLGDELAHALRSGKARPHDLFAACAHLACAHYVVSTYLPRRLAARQLTSAENGPWLEWVDGSLLFTDVSGSTALAERLTSLGREGTEIVTDTLNSYFGTMVRIIQAAGGDLLTFGGDALLVLFTGPDHAHTAAAVGLDLLRELSDFQRHVPGIGTFPLSMHIGVESGRVALVSAGQPHALRYSAMGATVNSVARAEGYGGKGELVLGPRTWAIVGPDAEGDELAEGYVRLHSLAYTTRPAMPPPDPPPPTLTVAALESQARQLERIAPYLPDTLLDRILADPQRPQVEADLRPVTVLFAQVAGLGQLVEALPEARAAAVVDAFLRPMQAAIQDFGGFVNKLDLAEEGDKLLAIFGAPMAYEDHAERAARAALAMQAALDEARYRIYDVVSEAAGTDEITLPPGWRPTDLIRLRVGLNTGNVFAGNVGSDERKEYTVMGDAVNVAARVMSSTAWGEIRCALAAADLLGPTLALGDPHRVVVKGKSEPLTLLRLDGEKSAAPTTTALAPLIGRSEELDWLRTHLEHVLTGQGVAARIAGEAGVGKSRLAAALIDEAADRGARMLGVRCHSFNTGTPYAPWGDLLRELCGIAPDDSHSARAEKLGTALAAAGVPADDWLPIMAELARLPTEDTIIVRALDPQQRQARRFEIMLQLLKAVTGRGSTLPQALDESPAALVVLFDNLHWADQVSLDLWQYVAAHITDTPILLLGLHRGPLQWGAGPQDDGAPTLELAELDAVASAELLDALAPDLDDGLREPIITRAAGNPLFLEELLRAVRESQNGLENLPDSLSGLLLARIDQLDERSRNLLRIASVIGQRFPVGLLQSVYLTDYQAIVRNLTRLDAEELTSTERELPERVHLFRHALLQEVVYQSLLYARRRELHRKIAEYLERRYAEELEQVRAEYASDGEARLVQIGRNGSLLSQAARGSSTPIFLLAHHYRLSDATERAVPYLLLAGHAARDSYANDQAVQYYRWALDLLTSAGSDPRTWEARESLGDVFCTLGRYDEAQQEYAAILESEPHPSPAVSAEVLRSWGDALEKQGRYAEALERLRQAEQTVEANLNSVPPLLLAAIYADMGTVLRRLGEYDQALAVCEAGLARIRTDRKSAEDERIEADLQQQIGTIHGMRGQYDKSRFHLENALAALEAIDDLYGCARTHNNLGYLAQLQSNYALAVHHYEEAEGLARKVSARYVLSSVQLNAAYAYYCLDRYADASEACHEVRAICAEMGDQDGIAKSLDLLGNIAFNRGAYEQALEHYDSALTIHRLLSSAYEEGNTLAMRAQALAELGRLDEAEADVAAACAIGERLEAPQLIVEALNSGAQIELCRADSCACDPPTRDVCLGRAGEQLGRAATLAEQLGSRLDYGVARRLAGEIAARRDQPFNADFEAALETFTAIRSGFEQARTWAGYGIALERCNDPAAGPYLKRAEETFRTIGAAGELRRLIARSERRV